MARILAWSDHPNAPTGFGRSANHVLYALHEAGHEIIQLAVNADGAAPAPWDIRVPSAGGQDPYGLRDLHQLVQTVGRVDAFWTTFDPEIPWRYQVPGANTDAMVMLQQLRERMGGMAMLGWFPVDGGPLSDYELGIMSNPLGFDVAATMSPHVHDLVEWTLRLKGHRADMDAVRERMRVIPHGVEMDAYTIPTHEARAAAKQRMGIDPDTFVILQLERNQQRKQNYLALEVMERLLTTQPKLRGKVVLYQHMLQDEETQASTLGFNLPVLAQRYAAGPDGAALVPGKDVLWPGGFVPEDILRGTVYPAADCFLSVSTGEGFQYPAWEALACGVPLVVPDTDARRAWFKDASNTHLYGATERRLVMRGGYNRRMNIPKPEEAARTIAKLIRRGTPRLKTREAGRAFVARVADHREVQAAWVELVEEELDKVRSQRMARSIVDLHVTEGKDYAGTLVDCSPAFGVGDTIMAAPALEALRKVGRQVAWALPPEVRWVAEALDVADVAAEPIRAAVTVPLHEHYHPAPSLAWTDPNQNRTEFIAKELAVGPSKLERFQMELPRDAMQQFQAQFLERFGVHPSECVGICLESGSPHRALPKIAALQLAQRVRGLGATPVLVGQTQLPFEHVGLVNLTGRTMPHELLYLCGALGAMVSVDTGPLYLAAVQGTPVVGVFTVVDPSARLRWVGRGTKATVTPPPDVEVAGQTFPAGPFPKAQPGEWAQHVKLADIVKALEAVTGVTEELEVEDGAYPAVAEANHQANDMLKENEA